LPWPEREKGIRRQGARETRRFRSLLIIDEKLMEIDVFNREGNWVSQI
jgi:hypothetical protein